MIPFKIKSPEETAKDCIDMKYGFSVPLTLATTPKKYAILLNGIPYTTDHLYERLGKLVHGSDIETLEVIDCKAYQEYLITL